MVTIPSGFSVRVQQMASWAWSVMGSQDQYGQQRGYGSEGLVEAENGEEALHRLLAEIPGPWDELDAGEEFTLTMKPAARSGEHGAE